MPRLQQCLHVCNHCSATATYTRTGSNWGHDTIELECLSCASCTVRFPCFIFVSSLWGQCWLSKFLCAPTPLALHFCLAHRFGHKASHTTGFTQWVHTPALGCVPTASLLRRVASSGHGPQSSCASFRHKQTCRNVK
jgi:hypothetical protein